MQAEQQHYIAGQWTGGGSHDLVSTSPINGATLWCGPAAGAEQVSRAVVAARTAFEAWSGLDFAHRQQYVSRFTELLGVNRQQLAEAIHRETGKPLWESRQEIDSMLGKAPLAVAACNERTGRHQSEANGIQLTLQHRPVGVFVVLGPFNFPGHLPNGHIIPGLLAGNTIVFKPSELTPLVADLMVQCWHQAGLPAGVLNLLQGEAATGRLLTRADGIDGLLFTGSSRTGHAIHQAFGGQPHKMLALEMGGNNALVVEQVADIPAAVYTIIQSAFISAGQRCSCARRLILLRSAANRTLLAALVGATQKLAVGFDEQCFLGPVVSNAAADQVLAFAAKLLAAGATVLQPLERPRPDQPLLRPGIVDVSALAASPDEECFGPLLQVHWVDSLAAGVRLANATRYGLAAGLLSDNQDAWDWFVRRIRAGIVNRNRPLTGASGAAPFGGIGASGNYRPGGWYAADYCAYPMAGISTDKLRLPDSLAPGIVL